MLLPSQRGWAVVQADAFQSQAGNILASAIQTARQNQANQIEINLRKSDQDYSIYRAQRDVIEYHNMCSLETALVQVQASLRNTAPDAGLTPPANQGNQAPNGLSVAAKREVDLTVATRPAAIPSSERLAGQTTNEEIERLRIRNVMIAQQALGVAADGKFGEGTRNKIEEFQRGMNARSPSGWRTSAIDGELRGETANWLTTMTPMPTGIFLSPFERAYLGNMGGSAKFTQPDPKQLGRILNLLNVPQARLPGDTDLDTALRTMRDEVVNYRKRNDIEASKGGEIDDKLVSRLLEDDKSRGQG